MVRERARAAFISGMPSKLHGTYIKQREKSGLRVALPRTGPEASAWAPEWERLASALWDQAEASGEPWEVVAKRVYQRFFVDGFAREQGFKAKMLLSNFAKYANPEARVAS